MDDLKKRLKIVDRHTESSSVDTKEVLNFNEAKQYLQFSHSKLRKLANSGVIPCVKSRSNKMYFNTFELDKWFLEIGGHNPGYQPATFRPHFIKERRMAR
ncbi:MAG: helix-turn-helix domain-containing protein [Bacteroidetes bacterium]|nr:helix-turn-helix domain-containing protein [Bacteroidota bacterium]